ncbi:MAG: TetR/AcrR family transcriptional regulator [Eggerthellales bacterium]|nr:TetR/AcrR family transcriptional regulator [Eggerthellales bacterium]
MAKTITTREEITEVAFRYINEHGLDGFSMRSIAQELGMGTMSVYRYFDNKDQLLSAVGKRLRKEYDNRPIPGERWDDTLRRTVGSIRKIDLKYYRVWSAERSTLLARGFSPSTRFHTRRIYSLHKDQGIPVEVYRRLWALIEAYLIGFISQEIAQIGATWEHADPADPDYAWLTIAENAYNDESFMNGLELIIDGVRAYAAPDPCEWYTPVDPSQWTWTE